MTSRDRDGIVHLGSGQDWIEAAHRHIVAALRSLTDPGARYGAAGSVADRDTDELSDLDLVVLTDRNVPLGDLVRSVAAYRPLWSVEGQDDENGPTVRAFTREGRHIDLLVRRDASTLPLPLTWCPTESLPAPRTPVGGVDPRDGVDPALMHIRHIAAVAATKLGRADALIGAHLTLEVAREALVLGMRRRDRDLGTVHHRRGTEHDRDAKDLSAVLATLPAGAGPMDWLDLLRRLCAVVDDALARLDTAHRPDWQGLDAIVDRARVALAGRHN